LPKFQPLPGHPNSERTSVPRHIATRASRMRPRHLSRFGTYPPFSSFMPLLLYVSSADSALYIKIYIIHTHTHTHTCAKSQTQFSPLQKTEMHSFMSLLAYGASPAKPPAALGTACASRFAALDAMCRARDRLASASPHW
jgi:hypothetical protein